jgi:arylamine N-acetyltransferase
MGDPVLRAVGFDIERRLAQVAVVGQPTAITARRCGKR